MANRCPLLTVNGSFCTHKKLTLPVNVATDHFTANQVKLEDWDITIAALIILSCCNLTTTEKEAICNLRQIKNDYLSHNTTGRITDIEYNSLWLELTTNILQLDYSKADDIIRIQNRPLDESLCNKYCIQLLDIHQKLDEINARTKENNDLLHVKLQELSEYIMNGKHWQFCKTADEITCSDRLGQSIFQLQHQFDITAKLNNKRIGCVTDVVMMDDGRLVLCLFYMNTLLICNTDGSPELSIQLQYGPRCVTAVNNSTVAVRSLISEDIEMYDINTGHKLKSIPVPELWCGCGITTINNKLVVRSIDKLYIIDHQTEKVEKTIEVTCRNSLWVSCVLATADRIFYNDDTSNNLCCYSYTDDIHLTTKLPSRPWRIFSLQDGSLYVVCDDGSVQHVSSDGKHYKPVTTNGLTSVGGCSVISYNQKQRQFVTFNSNGMVNVFHEMD